MGVFRCTEPRHSSTRRAIKGSGGDAIAMENRKLLIVYLCGGTEGVLNNLVIATVILALAQPSSGPPLKPITDPDAYAIYATLLPSIWKRSGELILLVQETETESCRVSRLPEEWEGVQEDFDRQNTNAWTLRPVLPLGDYRLIPRAEIRADDARLEQEYPGIWQRRPGSMEFAAVSAVGFNAAKTKALVYIRLRSSGQIHLMELRDGQWVASRGGVRCGWIA